MVGEVEELRQEMIDQATSLNQNLRNLETLVGKRAKGGESGHLLKEWTPWLI